MIGRISIRDYFGFLSDLLTGRRLEVERETAAHRRRMTAGLVDYSRRLTVLDLGSGALQPQVLLLEAEGHRVIGVDLGYCSRRSGFESTGYRIARWLFRKKNGSRVSPQNAAGLMCADVSRLPLCNDSVDLATSIAAFEHFLDVPQVVRELVRVLQPGGVLFVIVHPFTALSGGHNVQLMGLPITQLPEEVMAWDHLRERRIPITVPLNEWRIEDYLKAFSAKLEIIDHGCWMEEGRSFLTEEIIEELADFSEEELLWGTYFIVARKPERKQRAGL